MLDLVHCCGYDIINLALNHGMISSAGIGGKAVSMENHFDYSHPQEYLGRMHVWIVVGAAATFICNVTTTGAYLWLGPASTGRS